MAGLALQYMDWVIEIKKNSRSYNTITGNSVYPLIFKRVFVIADIAFSCFKIMENWQDGNMEAALIEGASIVLILTLSIFFPTSILSFFAIAALRILTNALLEIVTDDNIELWLHYCYFGKGFAGLNQTSTNFKNFITKYVSNETDIISFPWRDDKTLQIAAYYRMCYPFYISDCYYRFEAISRRNNYFLVVEITSHPFYRKLGFKLQFLNQRTGPVIFEKIINGENVIEQHDGEGNDQIRIFFYTDRELLDKFLNARNDFHIYRDNENKDKFQFILNWRDRNKIDINKGIFIRCSLIFNADRIELLTKTEEVIGGRYD